MSRGKILVTGATGRLGQAVVDHLGERAVAGVRRPWASSLDAIMIASDGSVCADALGGVEAVVNCAGRTTGSAAEMEQANVAYPLALARTAQSAGVRRFVQVSSFSVFGNVEYIDRASPIAPNDAYGRSKAAAEKALLELTADGFCVIPLRLPFMFSAQHPAHVARFTAAVLRLRALPQPAGRSPRRSMITYAGAAEALVSLAESLDCPDEALAAADPAPVELAALAKMAGELAGRRIVRLPFPEPAVQMLCALMPSVAKRLFRSSVLAASANMWQRAPAHSVEAELSRYFETNRSLAARQTVSI